MSPPSHDHLKPKARGPRLYHKKSRMGCVRCKQRRVKCDEARPSCGGCVRHMVDCVYQTPPPAAAAASSASNSGGGSSNPPEDAMNLSSMESELNVLSTPAAKTSPLSDGSTAYEPSQESTTTASSSPNVADNDGFETDLPESRERRIWELRLLHNSLTQAKPFPTPQHPVVQDLFSMYIPNMALNEGRDGVLYGTLAHSALNMWTRSSDAEERKTLIRLQRTYLSMMLREHRAYLSELSPANADVVCICSLKILTHALALIQTLPSEPWQPPTDFLQMGSGAGFVFNTSWRMAQSGNGGEVPKIMALLQTPPGLRDPLETILSDHSALDWVLEAPPGSATPDAEMADPATRSVYEKAIAFICSVQRALARDEPEFSICRRLGGFAVWVPAEFTQYLTERRPRAMVVLAHFMAMFMAVEHIWIIGQAGENQIRGILKNLPAEWAYKLDGLMTKYKKHEGTPPVFSGGYGALM
ncbi:hypothetical protein LQW54_007291 [Pestalotiopsis sp. IQ-011]